MLDLSGLYRASNRTPNCRTWARGDVRLECCWVPTLIQQPPKSMEAPLFGNLMTHSKEHGCLPLRDPFGKRMSLKRVGVEYNTVYLGVPSVYKRRGRQKEGMRVASPKYPLIEVTRLGFCSWLATTWNFDLLQECSAGTPCRVTVHTGGVVEKSSFMPLSSNLAHAGQHERR